MYQWHFLRIIWASSYSILWFAWSLFRFSIGLLVSPRHPQTVFLSSAVFGLVSLTLIIYFYYFVRFKHNFNVVSVTISLQTAWQNSFGWGIITDFDSSSGLVLVFWQSLIICQQDRFDMHFSAGPFLSSGSWNSVSQECYQRSWPGQWNSNNKI